MVFAHNDVQENNLLQTQYGLRLIDFEYANFNYAAHDIAGCFAEWTLDYICDEHPFFTVMDANYPSSAMQRSFCRVYLSEVLEREVEDEDCEGDRRLVTDLINSIQLFAMSANLLWAVWSIMRAPQAPTFDEFDFLKHCEYRLGRYLWAKEEWITRQADDQGERD